MKAVEPPVQPGARIVIFGANQEEYDDLPASVDREGCVMTEWELTEEETTRLIFGGHVRLWLLGTDVQVGRPMTPIKIEVILTDDAGVIRES